MKSARMPGRHSGALTKRAGRPIGLVVCEGTYDEANDCACRGRSEDRIPTVIIACPVIAGWRGIQAILVVITDVHGAGVRTVIAANPVGRDIARAVVRPDRIAIGGIAAVIARRRVIMAARCAIGIARWAIVVATVFMAITTPAIPTVIMAVTAIVVTVSAVVPTVSAVSTVMAAVAAIIASPVSMPAARVSAGNWGDGQACDGEGCQGFSECIHQFHGRRSLR